eukprot:TRINITY_DN7051_c0_g1_i2.p1 TRINITY_DN7051_c0_g1~~TRINITY_DN7051_c0_g1_i2.p1  ORF type:complete len:194 (-),score=30.78 TRINITY_DN7051_c0_g1_i2:99-680(-)
MAQKLVLLLLAMLLSLSLLSGCFANGAESTEDASSSSSSGDEHPCTKSLSCDEMQLLTMFHFQSQDRKMMICISYYAASWCPFAVSENKTGHGLWEIDESHLGQDGCPTAVEGLLDPSQNAKCAAAILNMEGLDAWGAVSEKCRGWKSCKDGKKKDPVYYNSSSGGGWAQGKWFSSSAGGSGFMNQQGYTSSG